MNHYRACALADGSGWYYTVHNNRTGTWAIGYCADHDPHPSELDAQICYTDYLLDNRLRLDGETSNSMRRCHECRAWTNHYAELDNIVWYLCDDHRTREVVSRLYGIAGYTISS